MKYSLRQDKGYHKSMALLVFHISTYLCTCAWVWLGSKLYARRGCVALWAKAFQIWLGLFSCKNLCAGPGHLHLGPTFSHIKRGQVWPLELASAGPCLLGLVQASWTLGWANKSRSLFNEVLDFLDIGPRPLEHS
jgi:hypothetical protein